MTATASPSANSCRSFRSILGNSSRKIWQSSRSKFIRAASARLLTNAGFTVRIAGDGEEGLRLVQENPPDLILLDMLLPKMGGAQVLQALKQNSVTAHIPVIVLSSLSQQNETKLKDEGAALYFEKSRLELDTGGATLVAAIERLLRTSKVAARKH